MTARIDVGMNAPRKPMRASVETLVVDLRRDGYAIVPGVIGSEEYEGIANTVGRVLVRSIVQLDSTRATYLCSAGAVPFHSDHPAASVIGWHCEVQDDEDGTSLLVDMRACLDACDQTTAKALEGVFLPCPDLLGMATSATTGPYPIIEIVNGERCFYYAHWLHPIRATRAGMAAWESLFECIEAAQVAPIEIRLRPGEALFIDNRRMLHGRRALREGSSRRLHRVWIAGELLGSTQRGSTKELP